MRILLIMEQCNPLWPSVPQVAYQIYEHLQRIAQVHLVTHQRNAAGLRATCPERRIDYVEESAQIRAYYRLVSGVAARGSTNWPLLHTLAYPVYAEFDRKVYKRYGQRVLAGEYDAVMAMSPVLPRYPYSIAKVCQEVPFILGPVNGGLPYPDGFRKIAWKEYAHFNGLRALGKCLPGYRESYRLASRVLAGSRHTERSLMEWFDLSEDKVVWMPENGVADSFFGQPIRRAGGEGALQLLFAGRLVAYKGADMVIEAAAEAQARLKGGVELSIVGDGPERARLEDLAKRIGMAQRIRFTGAVRPDQMPHYFRRAELFCFPSVREFGGAVVLEAMAMGVPCVVVDHGGIGEYVVEGTGIKIPPRSRTSIIEQMAEGIVTLGADAEGRRVMGERARERAREFSWPAKAASILGVIREAIDERKPAGKMAA